MDFYKYVTGFVTRHQTLTGSQSSVTYIVAYMMMMKALKELDPWSHFTQGSIQWPRGARALSSDNQVHI